MANAGEEWSLEDVDAAHAAHPDSFFVPPLEVRRSLATGRVVRLHFLLAREDALLPRAERMWVEISERSNDGSRFAGALTNQPLHLRTLAAGARIDFEARHIARILLRKGDPGWFACMERTALVSPRALAGGGTIRWGYREEPDRERDSGWRFFEGSETDEEANRDLPRVVNVGWLVDRDPTLLGIIEAPAGSAFERGSRDEAWRDAPFPEIED